MAYSSHTLEHFDKADGRSFLSECHRVLRPGGIIRIVVPDLHVIVVDYLEGRLRADDVVGELEVLQIHAASAVKNKLARFTQSAHTHKCMDNTPLLWRSSTNSDSPPRAEAPSTATLTTRAIEREIAPREL